MTGLLYTQAVERALEVHLEPVKDVIADLCDYGKFTSSRETISVKLT